MTIVLIDATQIPTTETSPPTIDRTQHRTVVNGAHMSLDREMFSSFLKDFLFLLSLLPLQLLIFFHLLSNT